MCISLLLEISIAKQDILTYIYIQYNLIMAQVTGVEGGGVNIR